jgi:hypothetical protein
MAAEAGKRRVHDSYKPEAAPSELLLMNIALSYNGEYAAL